MDYEKAYKDALERAKDVHTYYCDDNAQLRKIETIFPELRGSKDERIKKEILEIVSITGNENQFEEIKDWLEKQGEEKPIFNVVDLQPSKVDGKIHNIYNSGVAPKFKVGDWIVSKTSNLVYRVDSILLPQSKCYYLSHNGGKVLVSFTDEQDYHLWTIQDAKDGDVLACESGWTCIFKALVNDETFSSYCFMDETKWFCETGSECHTLKEDFIKAYNGKIYPATKEQRDLLFEKMHGAGYEWDAEKKELDKIEKQGEQKKSYDVCDSSMMDNKKSPYGEKRDFGYFEEKPADKVEPKFKVGDYIKHNKANIICKVISVNSGSYYVENIEISGRIELFNAEQNFHLWTIADAKPEDVLTCNSKYGQEIEIGIVKKYIGKYGGCDKCFDTYCFVDWDGIFRVDEYMGSQNIHPATKEQRDALFAKMKEAGYEWDNEKKEVKKIVPIFNVGDIIAKKHNSDINKFGQFTITDVSNGKYWYDESIICDIKEQDDWELVEQKPAEWSEEDEIRLDRICKTLWKNRKGDTDEIFQQEQDVDWLKSLKERVQPQPKQDWSEEDELRVKDTIYFLDTAKKHYASTVVLDACIDWLKSLKERIGG